MMGRLVVGLEQVNVKRHPGGEKFIAVFTFIHMVLPVVTGNVDLPDERKLTLVTRIRPFTTSDSVILKRRLIIEHLVTTITLDWAYTLGRRCTLIFIHDRCIFNITLFQCFFLFLPFLFLHFYIPFICIIIFSGSCLSSPFIYHL